MQLPSERDEVLDVNNLMTLAYTWESVDTFYSISYIQS